MAKRVSSARKRNKKSAESNDSAFIIIRNNDVQ